jgi:cyclopropane-fatty-acyl-phospholipid synthase
MSRIDHVKEILWRRNAFFNKYVFPEAELVPVAQMVASAERVGFELRDVESLREHYAITLRHWIKGLESHSDEVIRIVGERTYRVWRLFMSGTVRSFTNGKMSVVQALLVKPDKDGRSEMPLTRDYMYDFPARTTEITDSAAG